MLSASKNRLCFVDFGAKPALIGMPALETLFGHAPTAGDKKQSRICLDPGHKGGCGKQPCEEFEEAWPPLAWSAYLLREQHLVLGRLVCGTYAAPNTIL